MADTVPIQLSRHFAEQRRTMVDCQVRTFDVIDLALIDVLYEVPREAFVAPAQAAVAYADRTLTSAGGARQLLPPMVLARMIQAANVRKTDRVLDIAGGAGYSAAILARLAAHVTALEDENALTEAARAALAGLGLSRVACVTAPLAQGYGAGAPFDVVLINGMAEVIPDALRAQIAEGGRLLVIRGGSSAPQALRYEKAGADFGSRILFSTGAPALAAFQQAPSFVF